MNHKISIGLASLGAASMFIACVVAFSGGQPAAAAPAADTRRVVPVTNIVPNGAQPIRGSVVKVEVIDAVDIKMDTGNWRFKAAMRIRNARGERVKCQLAMLFDGKLMGQPWSVDLLDGQTDLVVFATYGGEGKGASQLSKLTAEARDIRIGN